VAALLDTDGNGGFDETTHFVYAGQAAWQLVEEYPSAVPTWSSVQGEEDHDTTVERSYAYGNYIDEVLTMRDHGSGEDFFYHQDDLFSVYAMTDEDGVVVERYEYGDYGQVSITAEDGTPRAASSYGNRHTFTGRLLCDELTLDDGGQVLESRRRVLMPAIGRWASFDPLEYFDSMSLYVYGISSPLSRTDPFGLSSTYSPSGWLEVLVANLQAAGYSVGEIAQILLRMGISKELISKLLAISVSTLIVHEASKEVARCASMYKMYKIVCDSCKTCNNGQSCSELLSQITCNSLCVTLRVRHLQQCVLSSAIGVVNPRWWNGHIEQIDNKLRALERCQAIYSSEGCSPGCDPAKNPVNPFTKIPPSMP